MGVEAIFLAYLDLIWPVLLVGVIVFVLWGAGKAAARESGAHLGVAGVGLVFVVLAAFSWTLGFAAIALLVGFIGFVALAVGLKGEAR